MSRVQLALNADDVEQAVAFYSSLFGVAPAKVRPGYANFAIEDPPLKLVLLEHPGAGGTLNHLGVEVGTADEVQVAARHLRDAGLDTTAEDGVACCYAVQDKVWVSDPDGSPWEVYAVLGHSDEAGARSDDPGAVAARSDDAGCGAGACGTARARTSLPVAGDVCCA
jgi:catechol 2,3-dioxygenase-like lactoylglutathione lyase family enzyme